MSHLLSVVMPVYNAAEFLNDSIRSVLTQTFCDFEFIIINDGSTDESLEILTRFAAVDKRIKIVSRSNKGLVYSLNEGVSIASGKWIARMDADDISLPKRFEVQLARLAETGAEICGGAALLFGQFTRRRWIQPLTDSGIKLSLCFTSPFVHSSVICSADLMKALKYNDSAKYSEDYDLWARMALAGIKMTNTPEFVLKYRLHTNQITSASADSVRMASGLVQIRYLMGLGFDSNSVEIFLKFTSSNSSVSMQDAYALKALLLSMNSSDDSDKLSLFSSQLRRVSPPSIETYMLYRDFAKTIGFGRSYNFKLFFQAIFGIDRNGALYNLLKRFVV